ncbi:MAG: hypothetical protein AAB373_03795 [Patescibacteria group bacterium]
MSENVDNLEEQIPDFANVAEAVNYFSTMFSADIQRDFIGVNDLMNDPYVVPVLGKKLSDMHFVDGGFFLVYDILVTALNRVTSRLAITYSSIRRDDQIDLAVKQLASFRAKLSQLKKTEILSAQANVGSSNNLIQ